jgi:hypothetical protein
VKRVDEFAWSGCLLAVVFRDPLHLEEIAHDVQLAPTMEYWDFLD